MIACAPALAAPQSRYTSLTGSACRTIEVGGQEASAEEQETRCPGLAGADPVVHLDHTRKGLGFAFGKSKTAPLFRAWGVGERLEWRGVEDGGRFRPYAAVVRALFARDDGRTVERQVLVVLKVAPGQACAMRVIDMTENRLAYDLARMAADSAARRHDCRRDAIQVLGVPSPWTAGFLGGGE